MVLASYTVFFWVLFVLLSGRVRTLPSTSVMTYARHAALKYRLYKTVEHEIIIIIEMLML